MALTTVTVTGTFQKSPAVPSTGNLTWKLSADLFQAGAPVASNAPVAVTLDAAGSFSVELWANDDPGTEPTGTFWEVLGIIDGQSFQQQYVLSHSMAPTVDLSQLTPATVGAPVYPVNAAELQGYPVAASVPSSGQVLVWDGSAWAPSSTTVGVIDGGTP